MAVCFLAACAAGCSSADDTRVELVSESCDVATDDVPATDEWVVDERGAEGYDVIVPLPDGAVARINFIEGTVASQLEENVRIASVACFSQGSDQIFPDEAQEVTWSPDGEAYTVEESAFW